MKLLRRCEPCQVEELADENARCWLCDGPMTAGGFDTYTWSAYQPDAQRAS